MWHSLPMYDTDEVVNELWIWEQTYGPIRYRSRPWFKSRLVNQRPPMRIVSDPREQQKQEDLQVYDFIRLLPFKKDRDILYMVCDGMTQREIGLQLGLHAKYVGKIIRRLRKEIRERSEK